MRYFYRVFLWINGQKTTDYTQYLTVPIFIEDRLNDQLSSGEVILDLMPLSTRNDFPPKTKLVIERYKKQDYSDAPKIWQMIVDHDDVEEYGGVPNTCCHRITLIEPSAIAQGMHIDNMALTYELQDVNLNYKTYTTSDKLVSCTSRDISYKTPLRATTYDDDSSSSTAGSTRTRNASFKNSYSFKWDEDSLTEIKQLLLELPGNQENTISFTLPKLYCYGSSDGTSFDKQLFQVNTVTNIYQYDTVNDEVVGDTKTLIATAETGPSNLEIADNEWYYSDGQQACLRLIDTSIVRDGYDSNLVIKPNTNTTFNELYITSPTIAQIGTFQGNMQFNTTKLEDADLENNKGYKYEIECYPTFANSNGFITRCEVSFWAQFAFVGLTLIQTAYFNLNEIERINAADKNNGLFVRTSFLVKEMRNFTETGPLLMKGLPYTVDKLLRKSLLTIDTQIIDNDLTGLEDLDYLIYVSPDWVNRLQSATVQETIFEDKNLWEILIQLGYYLHAVPYLQFADDGTDRFMLNFKQLGGKKTNDNTSNKITIFNSRNLNEYFTQLDSYVTNLFSPQNLVDEWLVPTTIDSSYLVSNETAELKTTYGITEVLAFDITYDGSAGGTAGTASALEHIFESSIYQILTSDYNVSPGKGDSLYYELGSNQILGLSYVPPSVNEGDMPMALKRIVGLLFENVQIGNLKFNDLKFHIKYRTQDSVRISQVRPDIQNFMKNSSYEKYPKHSQFYGQQDKIIDSERFSLNLFGQLIRVGNNIYQCQEAVQVDTDEKECGDLVQINGEPYYVTEIENEMYPDLTLQKVTYSKDYNQLSQIVTIPSEPRFYEISERSKVRREIMLFDFFSISTQPNTTNLSPRFLNNTKWKSFIKNILFRENEVKLPNYAWTRFSGDKKRSHNGEYGQSISVDELFPSFELDRTDPNNIKPKAASDHADNIVPLLHYPLKDGIVFEWDMEDNFKVGDCIDTELSGGNTVDGAYYALQSVRYCDVLGRADLFNFRLFTKTDWTHEQAQALPKACIEPEESDCIAYQDITKAIALDKDCREELSFNYQINLLHRNENNGGDFVTYSNLFGEKDGRLICCALAGNVSVFDSNMNSTSENILADNLTYTLVNDDENQQIKIQITPSTDLDISKVKAIVFYDLTEDGRVSYIAKNFTQTISAIPTLYIYPVFND